MIIWFELFSLKGESNTKIKPFFETTIDELSYSKFKTA